MAAFENLEFPNWSTKTKEHSLTARIYNGAISFTVWPKERGASGIIKKLIKECLIFKLVNSLKSMKINRNQNEGHLH